MSRSMIGGFFLAILCSVGLQASMRLALDEIGHNLTLGKYFWLTLHLSLLLAMIATYILGFAFHDFVLQFTREGGVVEWSTFWVALHAAGFFGFAAWRKRGERSSLFPLVMLILCLGIAGEEIAWGQHLMHFQPPDFFLDHNWQREVTVHNLQFSDFKLGPWVQPSAPLIAVLVFFAWQYLFPQMSITYTGFLLNLYVASFAILFAIYFFISSFPFSADVTGDIPLFRVFLEAFHRHSSPQSELSEFLFSLLLLFSGMTLHLVTAHRSLRSVRTRLSPDSDGPR